jgi:hypothetical protein
LDAYDLKIPSWCPECGMMTQVPISDLLAEVMTTCRDEACGTRYKAHEQRKVHSIIRQIAVMHRPEETE